MIGENPTVGCLLLLEKTCYKDIMSVVQALQAAISITVQTDTPSTVLTGEAMLGGSQHEMILLAQDVGNLAAVHIEFDEQQVMHAAQRTGLSLEQLFMPYVQAAKGVPGILAVGIGCELSPPAVFLTETIQESGIAVLFERDADHKSWSRQQTMPLIGHWD